MEHGWCKAMRDAKVIPLRGEWISPSDGPHRPPLSGRRASSGAHRRALTIYRWDDTPRSEWQLASSEFGRASSLAYVQRHPDGSRVEHWYQGNRLNRTDGPAVIEWAADGCVRKTEWWVDGRDVTAAAEAFLSETGARWPLDPGQESVFLCRHVTGGYGGSIIADRLSWYPLLLALCLVAPFWMLLSLSVVLLR